MWLSIPPGAHQGHVGPGGTVAPVSKCLSFRLPLASSDIAQSPYHQASCAPVTEQHISQQSTLARPSAVVCVVTFFRPAAFTTGRPCAVRVGELALITNW